ncbi:MAG: type IV toxin-antitoxin system AbiEi family antitoxin domain-containing protein [Gordonia amarae]
MIRYPSDSYGLVRRSALRESGMSDNQIAQAVRRGLLRRVYPGVLVEPSSSFDGHDGAQRLHRMTAIAVATSDLSTTDSPLPLCHATAAAFHGIPLLKPDISRVHVSTGTPSGGAVHRYRHLHAMPLDPAEVTVIDGIVVTTIERTAVDVATRGEFAQALTAFDQAIRLGGDAKVMRDILESRRRVGVRVARRALAFASGLSQSVGESWSRAQMIEAGLPGPRLQHRFHCSSGNYDTDFDWDEALIGEFDGLHKYGRLLKPGETAEQAVVREKLREDELRATDALVVRWIWSHLESHTVADLIRPRLQRLGLCA